jgi:hypothetical protein
MPAFATIARNPYIRYNKDKELQMTVNTKPYEELTYTDDFMFKRVMLRETICRRVLERILGKPVREIRFHETEKVMKDSPSSKGIRLDVYLQTDNTAYDIEMQTKPEPAIGRRSRYYQSSMDMDSLFAGKRYSELKDGVVIFICLTDPYNRKLARYTLRETCAEADDLDPKVGTVKIFLYAGGDTSQESHEMRQFLDYIHRGIVPEGDDLIRDIDETVRFERQDTRGKEDYRMYSIKAMDLMDEGMAKERAEIVFKFMQSQHVTFDKAADLLSIKEEDRDECRALIEKMKEKQPVGV